MAGRWTPQPRRAMRQMTVAALCGGAMPAHRNPADRRKLLCIWLECALLGCHALH